MALKTDQILDKLNEKLAQVDRSKRSFTVILFVHLRQEGKVVKSVVLDFNDLKISEIELAATSTADYPAERIDASITIDDNDFYLVATKETSFAALIEQGKVDITGNKQAFITLDEKFRNK
ncbi:uncharacterized protein LOC5576671 [Aedes aegypti]|uniref:SCP2 domain-containing protein n=1 Tax=Aedes aegypti TaxID=7159 RepID=A0A6I8TMX2_AEDAE|nr:uncharacterized protein LOC5576671 [Aedes aegypti]XP_021712971.1 uncharacterized protein LOC5576671 [Aedes aegypti]